MLTLNRHTGKQKELELMKDSQKCAKNWFVKCKQNAEFLHPNFVLHNQGLSKYENKKMQSRVL